MASLRPNLMERAAGETSRKKSIPVLAAVPDEEPQTTNDEHSPEPTPGEEGQAKAFNNSIQTTRSDTMVVTDEMIAQRKVIEKILLGVPMEMDPLDLNLPNEEKTKYSSKENGRIKAYSANTNQGIIRNYNEDRVSIILNIVRPKGKEYIKQWPKCSFFAVYDGHGGNACADYLKDNLHQFIVRSKFFPQDPAQAMIDGCANCENHFINLAIE